MKARYGNFDLLRLFLAMEVLVLHCLQIPQGGYHVTLPIPPVAGFVCLSGLLIPASYSSSRGWGHFAWKRLLRVLPAFALSFVVVWALFGKEKLWPTLITYLTAGISAVKGSANGSLWSLMVEEVLYLQHCLMRLVKGLWNVKTAVAMLILSMLGWLALKGPNDLAGYHPGKFPDMHMAAVCAFFTGCVGSFYHERIRTMYWPTVLGCLALSAALLYRFPAGQIVLIPLTCFLTVALAYCTPQIKWRFPDLSYGLYIYATPLLLWATYIKHWTAWPVLGFTIVAGLGLCLLSWYLVEAPALRLKDWRPGRKPSPEPEIGLEPATEPNPTPVPVQA